MSDARKYFGLFIKKETLFLILIVFFILVPKLGNPCEKNKFPSLSAHKKAIKLFKTKS